MSGDQVRGWSCALGVCALLVCTVARADFKWAMSQFDGGHYEAARAEFLALAALGDGNSQYNLGAMSLKGLGGPANKGTGVGWLLAAAENGYQELPSEKLHALKASLSEVELHDAQRVLDVYGHEALLRTTLPSGNLQCPGLVQGRPAQTNDPLKDFMNTHTGIILVAFTVGADGHLRDPELRAVVSDLTAEELAPVLFEPLMRWQWRPATLNKVPRDLRVVIKLLPHGTPGGHGGVTWQTRQLEQLHAAADGGNADAAYLYGIVRSLDDSQVHEARPRDFLLIAAQAGHPKAAHAVGRRFDGLSLCNKAEDPRKLPWLRYAGAAGETDADLDLVQALLSQGPSADQLVQIRSLLQGAATSDSLHAKKHAVALLAASSIEAIRLPEAALAAARSLAGSPIQSDPQMFEAVAAAQAANGDFAQAEAQQQIALTKAKALGWNTRFMDERLDAYRHKRAWYGDIFAVPFP
jgi:uncharacterized protein